MTHIRKFNESLMRSSTLRQLKRIQGEIDRSGGDAESKRNKKEDKFPNAYWIHNPITADNSGKRKISTYEDKAEGRSVDKALESNHIKKFDELNEILSGGDNFDEGPRFGKEKKLVLTSTWDQIFERLAPKVNNFHDFWAECEKIKMEYEEPNLK